MLLNILIQSAVLESLLWTLALTLDLYEGMADKAADPLLTATRDGALL